MPRARRTRKARRSRTGLKNRRTRTQGRRLVQRGGDITNVTSWVEGVKSLPFFTKSANAPLNYTFGDLSDSGALVLPAKEQGGSNTGFNITITVGGIDTEMDIRDIGAAIALILGRTKPVAELTKDEFSAWAADMAESAKTEESIRNSLDFLRSTESELRKQSGEPLPEPLELTKDEYYPLFIWALAVNVQNAEETAGPSLLPAPASSIPPADEATEEPA